MASSGREPTILSMGISLPRPIPNSDSCLIPHKLWSLSYARELGTARVTDSVLGLAKRACRYAFLGIEVSQFPPSAMNRLPLQFASDRVRSTSLRRTFHPG